MIPRPMIKDIKNHNGIYVIEQFIDIEYARYISQTIQPLLQPSESPLVQNALPFFKKAEAKMISKDHPVIAMGEDITMNQLSAALTSTLLDIKEAVANVYNTSLDFSRLLYNKMLTGLSIPLHTDFSTKAYPYDNFTALLYINESGLDYTGGQIHFPKQDFFLSPRAGTLVFFQGNEDRPHKVTKIASGYRESIIMSFSSREANIDEK